MTRRRPPHAARPLALATLVLASALAGNGLVAGAPAASGAIVEARLTSAYPSSPVVGDLDGDGLPEIVASDAAGYLNVWTKTAGNVVTRHLHLYLGSPHAPALGDVNADGRPEIVVYAPTTGYVHAVRPDGSTLWRASVGGSATYSFYYEYAIELADVNRDGFPDAIVPMSNAIAAVSGRDGAILWKRGLTVAYAGYSKAAAADLDADGVPEVVLASGTLYVLDGRTGATRWTGSGTDVGVADLDLDGSPEVVASGVGGVRAYSASGALLWSRSLGIYSSGPAIADLNLDGKPEVAVGSTDSHVYALDGRGGIVWDSGYLGVGEWDNPDLTATDLDNDGAPEITVMSDDVAVVILDGRTGRVVANTGFSVDENEHSPAIADVDADGHAEIVVPSAYHGALLVIGDDANWAPTRGTWNQMSYYATNVNGDLSITDDYAPWKTFNTWRTQIPAFARLDAASLDIEIPPVATLGGTFAAAAVVTSTSNLTDVTVRVDVPGAYAIADAGGAVASAIAGGTRLTFAIGADSTGRAADLRLPFALRAIAGGDFEFAGNLTYKYRAADPRYRYADATAAQHVRAPRLVVTREAPALVASGTLHNVTLVVRNVGDAIGVDAWLVESFPQSTPAYTPLPTGIAPRPIAPPALPSSPDEAIAAAPSLPPLDAPGLPAADAPPTPSPDDPYAPLRYAYAAIERAYAIVAAPPPGPPALPALPRVLDARYGEPPSRPTDPVALQLARGGAIAWDLPDLPAGAAARVDYTSVAPIAGLDQRYTFVFHAAASAASEHGVRVAASNEAAQNVKAVAETTLDDAAASASLGAAFGGWYGARHLVAAVGVLGGDAVPPPARDAARAIGEAVGPLVSSILAYADALAEYVASILPRP